MIAENPKPPLARAVNLVIPTKDRSESLAATLNAVANLVVPQGVSLEVVIVLDGCTDDSAAVVDRWRAGFAALVTCVVTDGLGAGGARNAGIERAVEATAADLYTANAMMPLSALQAVGGFDASLKRAEDVDLGYRLFANGVKFKFLPNAIVAHSPIRTLSSRQKITTVIYCAIAQSVGMIAHWARLQSVAYAAYSSVYNVMYFGTLHHLKLQGSLHHRLSNP